MTPGQPADPHGARVKFSAAMVTFNEAEYLRSCLERLHFCDEIVVLDLGSSDGSPVIAAEGGARVVSHPWVPYAPMVRKNLLEQVSNEWVISIDPDMLFPTGADQKAQQMIEKAPSLGMIGMSYRNLFKGKPLSHGRWGGLNPHFPAIVNKERVEVIETEHRGHFRIRPPYSYSTISNAEDHVLEHLWAASLEDVMTKLRRYAPGEARARYEEGRRASELSRLRRSLRAGIKSYVFRRGFLEGYAGAQLAAAAWWYEWTVETLLKDLAPGDPLASRSGS